MDILKNHGKFFVLILNMKDIIVNSNNIETLKISQLTVDSSKSALYTIRNNLGYLLSLAGICWVLPYLVFDWIYAARSIDVAIFVKSLVQNAVSNRPVEEILGPVSGFLPSYLLFILLMCLSWGAFALYLSRFFAQLESKEWGANTFLGLKNALVIFLKRGLILAILMLILLMFLQGSFFALFIVFSLLLLTPIASALNPELGAFTLFKRSLFLSHAEFPSNRKLQVFFQLISYHAFILLCSLLIESSSNLLLNLDHWFAINRSFFITPIWQTDIPAIFIAASIFRALAYGIVMLFAIGFLTNYYLYLQRIEPRLEK